MRCFAVLLALALATLAQEIDRGAIELMPGLSREQRQALMQAVGRPAEMERAMAGLDADAARRLRRMPKGDLREERYNHSVLLEIPDLDATQRDFLEAAVTAADAAERALLVQRRTFEPLADAETRPRILSSLDRQRYETEQRFWQVVQYLLEPAQVRWARDRLSPRYRLVRDPEQQIVLLDGLTPSQTSRTRALFAEFESERAADDAAIRSLQVRLKTGSLEKAENVLCQREIAAASGRLEALADGLRDAIHALLTPEQLSEFESTPPLLGAGQRGQAVQQVLASIPLTKAESARATELQKEFARERDTIQKGMSGEYGSMMKEGLGPESPQQMTMETMRRNAYGRVLDRMRAMGARYVRELLTPARVARWIVDPTRPVA